MQESAINAYDKAPEEANDYGYDATTLGNMRSYFGNPCFGTGQE